MTAKKPLQDSFQDKLWLKSYPEGIDWHATLNGRPLGQMFDDSVKKYADRVFINFMGNKYTFKETGNIVEKLAAGMQAQGLGKGSKVGLCLPNTPYYVFAYFAAQKIGATVVNLNPLYAEEELVELCRDAKVDMLFTIDAKKVYPVIDKIKDRAGIGKVVVCSLADALPGAKKYALKAFNPVARMARKSGLKSLGKLAALEKLSPVSDDAKTVRFSALLKNKAAFTPVEIDPDSDVAVYQYTGGTTGLPKAAMLTHSNVSINVEQLRMWFTTMKPGDEKVLAVLPFFHVFAMTTEMNLALDNGLELIMMPEFEINAMLKIMEQEKPTIFAGVPNLYKSISDHQSGKPQLEAREKQQQDYEKLPRILKALRTPPKDKPLKFKKYDLSSLRTCIAGGAALDKKIKADFEALTGCTLVEGYGLSETSPVVAANPIEGVNKPGSFGLMLPQTEIKLRDLDDPSKTVPLGEKGEICLRGPQVMKGYLNNPEATANTIDQDGWLATGDVGVMDEDGYVFIVDRIKDMILTNNGLNVYPGKVEKAIMQHDDVAEVIVLGVKDNKDGQTIKAFIVMKPGAEKFDRAALKTFLSDKLSPYEVPRVLEFRDELPKTMIGKPDKKALRLEEDAKAQAKAPAPKPPKP